MVFSSSPSLVPWITFTEYKMLKLFLALAIVNVNNISI